MLDAVGLKSLFAPWLGQEETALTTLALISVWQFVGIPMMLIYAALLSIPDEVIEAAEMDGITGWSQFWKIKLPLILPAIGIISILTFVGNFNAFDLIYVSQGALAGPNFATDILGTFLYRTFFGFQLQLGDPHMGAAIATAMFVDHPDRRLDLPLRHPDAAAPLPVLIPAADRGLPFLNRDGVECRPTGARRGSGAPWRPSSCSASTSARQRRSGGIRSFRAAGHEVRSATMRRANMNQGFVPDWPNIDLGRVENERLGRRLAVIAAAVALMARRRRALDTADVIVARNLDMLAIAWAARLLAGRTRIPLVYECLDIHGLLTRTGLLGAAARWAERRLLARTALTLVSSPGFTREWFGRVQGHRGRVVLLENKLWCDTAPPRRPATPRRRAPGAPLTLGWVGSLRCAPSLRLLLAAADAMGPALRLRLHGNVHRHALPDFDAAIAARANVTYHGPYPYPEGLAEAYRGLDLVWAQDLWQRGGNSDWLLPNRIYEASWFGCPSVAVSDSETGRRIAADGLGFVIAEPTPDALVALLRGLDAGTLRARSAALLARDERDFRLTAAEVAAALFLPDLGVEHAGPATRLSSPASAAPGSRPSGSRAAAPDRPRP